MRVNEHLWSGIIRRSETGEVRKEDDVDLLDKSELVDYIERNYKCIWKHHIYINSINISVGGSIRMGSTETISYFNDGHCELRSVEWGTLNKYLQEKGYNVKPIYTIYDENIVMCHNIKTNTQFLKLLDDFIEWCNQYFKCVIKKGEK
jgi:hypothetical protein